jgi:hypothetical protein
MARKMTELALFSLWAQLTYPRPHSARATQLLRTAVRKNQGLARALLRLTDEESNAWFSYRRAYLKLRPDDEVFVPDVALARVRIYEADALMHPESDA